MYPEIMVIPMREELTRAGIKEARTAAEVDAALAKPGTTMLVVNSICGCAAGKMRPGVRMALNHGTLPDQSSAMASRDEMPLANACPWGRCVEVTQSSRRRTSHTPTATASWPWYW